MKHLILELGHPFLKHDLFSGECLHLHLQLLLLTMQFLKPKAQLLAMKRKIRHPTHATKSINCSVTYLNCFCSISKNWQIWSFFVVEIWDLSTQIFEAVFKMSSSENESDIWVIYYTALRKLFWLENLTTKLTMFPLIRDVLWLRSCASARAINTHPRDFLMNI